MSAGEILLGTMALMVVGDLVMALYFRSLADRVESGGTVSSNLDPEGARRTATLLLESAPLVWLAVVLFSFCVIPFRDRRDQILVE
jgi:hypothetical protein